MCLILGNCSKVKISFYTYFLEIPIQKSSCQSSPDKSSQGSRQTCPQTSLCVAGRLLLIIRFPRNVFIAGVVRGSFFTAKALRSAVRTAGRTPNSILSYPLPHSCRPYPPGIVCCRCHAPLPGYGPFCLRNIGMDRSVLLLMGCKKSLLHIMRCIPKI